MSWFNSALVTLLSFSPKWIVKPFAFPYVAGETEDEMVKTVRRLNDEGFMATIDILGEHVHNLDEAREVKDSYLKLYPLIASEGLDANISVKLTHFGLHLDRSNAERNLLELLEAARQHQNFLRLDMENSPYTDDTILLYRTCKQKYSGVGTVLQSYFHRTLNDITVLNNSDFNVRICKGIYRESPTIAYQDPEKIRSNFIKAVQQVITGGGYAAIATHDTIIIDALESWIIQEQIQDNRYEFQVLHGVPMGNRLKRLLANGHRVRVYVPYGKSWYDYAIRRLKENPGILWYVLKNLFRK